MAQNCKTSSYKKVLHPSKPHQILEGCYAPAYIDTVWKNAKFTLIEKIFRQINFLIKRRFHEIFAKIKLWLRVSWE